MSQSPDSSDAAPRAAIGAAPASPEHFRSLRPIDWENPHPLYVVWEITLKCDLGCKHCGSRAGHARDDELNTAQCLDTVRELSEMGVREVTLIGGEAYLREDWDIIARAITDRGMAVGITTGARNLTDERIQRAVDAGVQSISISLDGLERTHDAQRGARGAWRAATEAARKVAKTRMRLATNTQINRLSLPEVPALADLLVDLGSKAWQIQLTVPMGRGADRPDLLLQPWELAALFPVLVYIKREKLDAGGVKLYPGNNVGYFGPYEAALRHFGERGAHWGGCPAGKWSLGLEADGKIKACPSLPSEEYTGGMIGQRPIADVVYNSPELTFIKNRTREDLWGYCRECYYADVCKAGCTWTSQVFFGKPGNNPYCVHRSIEMEKRGVRETLVQIERAPGRPFDQGRFDIVEEPLDARPVSFSGFPLEHITAEDWKSGGVWTEEQLAAALAPKLAGPTRTSRLHIVT